MDGAYAANLVKEAPLQTKSRQADLTAFVWGLEPESNRHHAGMDRASSPLEYPGMGCTAGIEPAPSVPQTDVLPLHHVQLVTCARLELAIFALRGRCPQPIRRAGHVVLPAVFEAATRGSSGRCHPSFTTRTLTTHCISALMDSNTNFFAKNALLTQQSTENDNCGGRKPLFPFFLKFFS